MREVVIVGGGLTGLSAAIELEKHQIPFTLIEVKRRLGGSIQTIRQTGFVMDALAMAVDSGIQHEPLMLLTGLQDDLIPIETRITDESGTRQATNAVAFKNGTESLIEGMLKYIHAPRMMRMAVSSIGEFENGRYALCLENGLVLDAGSIILAIPARYAERMFYGYRDDIAKRLLGFPYDSLLRVSIGLNRPASVTTEHILPQTLPPEITSMSVITQPERLPSDEYTLIQGSMRIKPDEVNQAQSRLVPEGYAPPVTRFVYAWAEADPIFTRHHSHNIEQIRAMLPPGIALAGSDYESESLKNGIPNLVNRIEQGRAAANRVIHHLKSKSS